MTCERQRREARFCYWAALVTGFATLFAFAIAIATPPLSGAWCREGCLEYPYAEIATRYPRDYYWMFPAMVATLGYVAFMVGLHGRAGGECRSWSRFAVILAAMAGAVITTDYFLQLSVIQPSIVAGETDGVSLLTQYNPHGIFIALEEFGYLLVSLSLVCMVPAMARETALERSTRRVFVVGGLLNALALAWILLRFGHERGYLFEIVVISVDWLMLIAGTFMMAPVFRREMAAQVELRPES